MPLYGRDGIDLKSDKVMRLMKLYAAFFVLPFLLACTSDRMNMENTKIIHQTELSNDTIAKYQFLPCMYGDAYFPEFLVDKCKVILVNMCGNLLLYIIKT